MSLNRTSTSANDPGENQAKFCNERVSTAEKTLGALCETLGSMNRKSARLRDKGDILANVLTDYARTEPISHSTKAGLAHFAQNLAAIQDYRQAAIQRTESKVIRPLADYGAICKQVKNVVKSEQSAIKKEHKTVQQLMKVQQKKPDDAHEIAETELQKAKLDANAGSENLEKQMDAFEQHRLKDLKQIMTDFVQIELLFHARALEYYSKCFDNIEAIDSERDLEEFRRKLRLSKGVPIETMSSFGTSEYTSTSGGYSTLTGSGMTSSDGTTAGYSGSSTLSSERRVRINTQTMYDDDDDDEEDEDEDEDEDFREPVRRRR